MSRRTVRLAQVLLAVYVVALVVALFSPSNDHQSAMLVWLSHRLQDLGIPYRAAPFSRLEIIMNALIIAPVSFLGSYVVRWGWRDWTAWAFVAACAVETVQGLLLSGRLATFSDVVANTAGALLGAVLFRAIRSMLRRIRSA